LPANALSDAPHSTPDTMPIDQPTQIRRSRLAGERVLSVAKGVTDPPHSRASSLPQRRRLLRDSAASGRRANSYNSRPAQKPRQRQIPCRSNRRLRRSRRRQVCDINGAGHTAIAGKRAPTHSASASILKQPRAALLARQPSVFTHVEANSSANHFQGAGSPNNRPCTPSIPISTITRRSPSVSTRSAINGRSILCAARWTASMNNRLWLSSSIARM
jgi:hypothetical protein